MKSSNVEGERCSFQPVRDPFGLQRIQRYLGTYIGHKYSEENS